MSTTATRQGSTTWRVVCAGILLFATACAAGPAASPSARPPAPAAQPAAPAAPPGERGAPAAAAPTAVTERVPLSFAYLIATAALPFLLAYERGYFEEFGIEPHLEVSRAGQDTTAFVASGQLAGAFAGFSAGFLNAVQRGLDIRFVTSSGKIEPGTHPLAVMVRKPLVDVGEIQSLADLKGRRFAITGGMGSTNAFYLAQVLEAANAGYRVNEVELVNLDSPSTPQAFVNGSVDATHISEPRVSYMTTNGIGVQMGPTVRYSAAGLLVGPTLLRERRDLGARTVAAIVKGVRTDLQGKYWERPEIAAIITKYLGIEAELVPHVHHFAYDSDLRPIPETFFDLERVFRPIPSVLQYDGTLTADRVADMGLVADAENLLRR